MADEPEGPPEDVTPLPVELTRLELVKANFRALRTPILLAVGAVAGALAYSRLTTEYDDDDDDIFDVTEVTE